MSTWVYTDDETGVDEMVETVDAPEEQGQVAEEVAPTADAESEQPAAAKKKEWVDDEEYGARVQKRIDREVAKRKREREEFEAKLAQVRASQEQMAQELAAYKATLAEAELKKREAEAVRRLHEAEQNDDVTAKVAAQRDLFDVQAETHQARREREAAKQQQQYAAAYQTPQAPVTPEAEVEWRERNEWFDGTNVKSQQANAIYRELLSDYRPDSPRLYKELDNRLAEWEAAQQPSRQVRPGLGASSGTVAPAGAPRKNPGTLTARDKEVIRTMGKDPNDPAVLATYLKLRTAAQRT